MDIDNDVELNDQNKHNITKGEKEKKDKKPRPNPYNKLLPSQILYDLKSGFVKKDSEIPEPIYFLDHEYRLRLHSNLNKF